MLLGTASIFPSPLTLGSLSSSILALTTLDCFKKSRDTKGTFYAKMGSIKDRNGMDLTEAEDIKKRWQEYWSGLQCLPLGDLPDTGIQPTSMSPALAGRFLTTSTTWQDHQVQILQGKCNAAAAKSLQSCPTLCDLIDGSPPGSVVPGILQARTLEWVAISFSNA